MNPLLELRGQPGQAVGALLVPGSGKTSFTLKGNRLIIQSQLSWNLEKKRTVIRVKERVTEDEEEDDDDDEDE